MPHDRTMRHFSTRLLPGTALDALTFEGVANTGVVDSYGDSVPPEGAEWVGRDVPLLAAHNAGTIPVGRATPYRAPGCIKIVGRFAEPGVSAAADEWRRATKAGLVTALSIGFLPIERQPLKGGGYRYTRWKLLEVSLCAVGANPEAVITAKSLRRAGRVLSRANVERLTKAMEHHGALGAAIKSVLDDASDDPACDPEDPEYDPDLCDEAERARARARRFVIESRRADARNWTARERARHFACIARLDKTARVDYALARAKLGKSGAMTSMDQSSQIRTALRKTREAALIVRALLDARGAAAAPMTAEFRLSQILRAAQLLASADALISDDTRRC